jgi:hypothetical protein
MSNRDESICDVNFNGELENYFTTALITDIGPTDYHQNNASLFKLARLVKSYERAIARSANPCELEFVFDRWCSVASRCWRPELTRDDYYAEFLEAYTYAHTGLTIELAVSRAKAGPLPEVQGFTNARVQLLVAICREMQEITGASAFFLPTRRLGEILGVHHSIAARLLRVLRALRSSTWRPAKSHGREVIAVHATTTTTLYGKQER